jgi:4-diphosphocytidyl-2-C-methyl-D-erythritol kinase
VNSSVFFAPAKINLFLAVTGRRPDGFHDLVSLVAPVAWGDTLRLEPAAEEFTLECDDHGVPRDETNLVLKAARAFRAATGWTGGARFFLEKRIPMGAGLGGGSSDAAAALRGLNQLSGGLLPAPALERLASEIGSDCPLFLRDGPVVMRGRGERIETLSETAKARLRGRRVLIFKPPFGVPTPWAYGRLAADAAGNYLPAPAAEAQLARWIDREAALVDELLFNSFEPAVFAKFVALPVLLAELRKRFRAHPGMSGSGSACFLFLSENTPVSELVTAIRSAWGNPAFVVETRMT